jgi:hypothetical protein
MLRHEGRKMALSRTFGLAVRIVVPITGNGTGVRL